MINDLYEQIMLTKLPISEGFEDKHPYILALHISIAGNLLRHLSIYNSEKKQS